MTDIPTILRAILDTVGQSADRGQVADYIPELASVDPAHFGKMSHAIG